MNSITKICVVEDCDGVVKAREHCSKHYQKFFRPTAKRPDGYLCYHAMYQRCTNPNAKSYNHYGGRGIKICDRWLGKGGFSRMIDDIGPRPSKDYSLNRIDVNGNYEPGNVVWSEWYEQANNRSTKHDGVIFLRKQDNPKRWRAVLSYKRQKVLDKCFATYEEALAARKEAEREYFDKYKVTQ